MVDFSEAELTSVLNELDDILKLNANDNTLTNFDSYFEKPMEQWSSEEVVDFIYINTLLPLNDFDWSKLEKFKCISGNIFKGLGEHDCKILAKSERLGSEIFKKKEEFIRCRLNSLPDTRNYNSNLEDVFNINPDATENLNTKVNKNTSSSKKTQRLKTKTTSRLGRRSEKVWEFLLQLLRNSDTCPHLIKWENFEEGTFKFVQSSQVATLWGKRKNNKNMTYEKFSRTIRYHYKNKVLLPVPGQRLVYRFGPQAKGWKDIRPIC